MANNSGRAKCSCFILNCWSEAMKIKLHWSNICKSQMFVWFSVCLKRNTLVCKNVECVELVTRPMLLAMNFGDDMLSLQFCKDQLAGLN